MLPKTWTQAEFEFVCLLLIFPHSGDSGLPTGGWVGPPWAWGQGVGPARLLDRVTRLCRPACVIERPHISVAAEAFSLELVSFAREEPSHLPPGRQHLGRWAQGRGTLGLREQAGRDLHSGLRSHCTSSSPPPTLLLGAWWPGPLVCRVCFWKVHTPCLLWRWGGPDCPFALCLSRLFPHLLRNPAPSAASSAPKGQFCWPCPVDISLSLWVYTFFFFFTS